MASLNTKVKAAEPYVDPSHRVALEESALAGIRTVLRADGIVLWHRRELLGTCVWKFTEAAANPKSSKYRIRYRTPAAMDYSVPADVQHEHVWTRKWIIDRLIAAHERGDSDDALADIVRNHAVACTVTKDEHTALTAVSDAEGWDRYKAAGIEVIDMLTNERLDSTADRPEGVVAAEPFDVWLMSAPAAKQSALAYFVSEISALDAEVIVPTGTKVSYVRIHDSMLNEPLPAVAYLHPGCALHLRLSWSDAKELVGDDELVKPLSHKTYATSVDVSTSEGLALALALLESALELIRGA